MVMHERDEKESQKLSCIMDGRGMYTKIQKRQKIIIGQRKEECYVCKGTINHDPLLVGKGLYRHHTCKAGSDKWMHSEPGKKSKLRQFFAVKED